MLDYLADLALALDKKYHSLALVHYAYPGDKFPLKDRRPSAVAQFARLTRNSLLNEPVVTWGCFSLSPEGRTTRITLSRNPHQHDAIEVRLKDGTKTDELVISDILGDLNEKYPERFA